MAKTDFLKRAQNAVGCRGDIIGRPLAHDLMRADQVARQIQAVHLPLSIRQCRIADEPALLDDEQILNRVSLRPDEIALFILALLFLEPDKQFVILLRKLNEMTQFADEAALIPLRRTHFFAPDCPDPQHTIIFMVS